MTRSEVDVYDERGERFLDVEDSIQSVLMDSTASETTKSEEVTSKDNQCTGSIIEIGFVQWSDLREREQEWMLSREEERGDVPEHYQMSVVKDRSYVTLLVDADGQGTYRSVLEVLPTETYPESDLGELISEYGGSPGEVSVLNERVVSLWRVDEYDVWWAANPTSSERLFLNAGLAKWNGNTHVNTATLITSQLGLAFVYMAIYFGVFLQILILSKEVLPVVLPWVFELDPDTRANILLFLLLPVASLSPLAVVGVVHKMCYPHMSRLLAWGYQLVSKWRPLSLKREA